MIINVIDLEATCWKQEDLNHDEHKVSEIIEIGVVKLDLQKGVLGQEFSKLVKPILNPILSPFCTELTGIRQEDLKGQARFLEAFNLFTKFMGSAKTNILAGWGAYDGRALTRDAQRVVGPDYQLPYEYWNVKNMYAAKFGKRVGLGTAIEQMGLTFEGRPHRALPDAKNTARVLVKLFHPDAQV